MSDLGLRIADLKTRRQESADWSYEAEVRGRKSQIRGQTTEDKKEQNIALQIFDFAIRNSKFYPILHALCLPKATISNLQSLELFQLLPYFSLPLGEFSRRTSLASSLGRTPAALFILAFQPLYIGIE